MIERKVENSAIVHRFSDLSWLYWSEQVQARTTREFRVKVPRYGLAPFCATQPSRLNASVPAAGIHSPLYKRAMWMWVPVARPPSQEG